MKKKILDTAIDRFTNEGFFSTSMQKIAEDCGMSKATLYKYFESKEELLIQVFEYTLEQMFERSKHIRVDSSLSNKDRLQKRILFELQGNKEYRVFLNLIFKAIPIQQNQRVISLMKRTRAAFLNWHREYLIEAYGEEVQPYLWDLVLLLQGTLREYIHLLEDDQQPLDKERVATLIASHIDQIISSKVKPSPALSAEVMRHYENVNLGQVTKTREELMEEVLSSVEVKLMNVEVDKKEIKSLKAAFDSLKNEMLAAKPEKYMVEALSLFIDSRVNIKEEIPIILSVVEDL